MINANTPNLIGSISLVLCLKFMKWDKRNYRLAHLPSCVMQADGFWLFFFLNCRFMWIKNSDIRRRNCVCRKWRKDGFWH